MAINNTHTAHAVFDGVHYLTISLTNISQGSVTFVPYEQHSDTGIHQPYFGTFIIRGPEYDPTHILHQLLTFKSDNNYIFWKYPWGGGAWNLTPEGVEVNWNSSTLWEKNIFLPCPIRINNTTVVGWITIEFLHDGDSYNFHGTTYPPGYTHPGYDMNGNII
jgi:hypothetical protein